MNIDLICRKFLEKLIIGNPRSRWEDIINMDAIKGSVKSRPFVEVIQIGVVWRTVVLVILNVRALFSHC
jgi:hypothetical protein